jgi:glycosyltransferase involved in cell wall biosynthesis
MSARWVGIPTLPRGIRRPRWSVMIPVFNCAALLRQTLESVLAQDPGAELMQIEVVDDHSTLDDPRGVVDQVGAGRVAYHRQPENVGYIRNFETCLLRARGELVHLLHGDDFVRPGFYTAMQRAFAADPSVGMAFCRSTYLDENGAALRSSPLEQPQAGVLAGWLPRIAAGQRLTTPAVVVRRDVYERLGSFDGRFSRAGEDWEMWVRIAAHYPVWYEPEPLAAYRVVRRGSLTDGARYDASVIHDMLLATDIIASYLPQYLPAETAEQIVRGARSTYAAWALQHAQALLDHRFDAALLLLREALRGSREPWVVVQVLKHLARGSTGWVAGSVSAAWKRHARAQGIGGSPKNSPER